MIRVTAAIALIAIALIGCDPRPVEIDGHPAEVRIGYFPNLTHAQAVLGVESGDFAAAVGPSKLTARTFNAGPDLISELLAHHLDIGYVGPGPATNAFARSRGRGIRIIAGSADDGVGIVARAGSGIRTFADLKGRLIATPQSGNTQDIAARHFLMSVLGQTDTSNVKPIANADQPSMMAAGKIDAAWSPEPWGSILMKKTGATLVTQEKDLWPGKAFTLTVVVTTPEFLQRHPEIVARVLAVHRQWTQRLAADPQKYAGRLDAALAKLNGKPLPAGVTADALTRIRFSDSLVPGTLEANAKWAYELGFSREEPVLAGFVDESILDRRNDQ
jgi:NitT/TauT family transport system substrate-binding protein